MDKNGKLFGKISILDIFVLVLIIGVAVGTVYRYTASDTTVFGGNATIQYTARISGVRTFTVGNYQVGLQCFDAKTSESIGVIRDVRVEPISEVMETLTGRLVLAERDDIVRIYLDIEATGIETEQAYLVNGNYEIKAGSELLLATKYVDVSTTIDSVTALQ